MALEADVILPAAGCSERMKLPVPKQFQNVCGHPVIAYTIDCFHRLSWIRHIVVVVDQRQEQVMQAILDRYNFYKAKISIGGTTRHRSIYCGVQALSKECCDSDVVLIHDGARPFVSEDVALKIAVAASSYQAAGVTRPLVSTVIRGDESGDLAESLDRQLYRNSEMPQAFHYGVIANAYRKCTEYDFDYGTECLLLVLKYSHCAAHLVDGTDDLWKVTYQKDLYAMESTVKEKMTTVAILKASTSSSMFLSIESKLYESPLKVVSIEEGVANTFILCLDLLQQPPSHILSKISTGGSQVNQTAKINLSSLIIIIFTPLEKEAADETILCKDKTNADANYQAQSYKCEGRSDSKCVKDRENCLKTLSIIQRSVAEAGDDKAATVVGILAKTSPQVADQVLKLAWHRAEYINGQLLDWTSLDST